MRSQNRRKATINFVMSVFPHGTTRLPQDGFLGKFIFEDFSKVCRENDKFHQNLSRYTGTLRVYLCTFMVISRLILLRTINVETEVVEKV